MKIYYFLLSTFVDSASFFYSNNVSCKPWTNETNKEEAVPMTENYMRARNRTNEGKQSVLLA